MTVVSGAARRRSASLALAAVLATACGSSSDSGSADTAARRAGNIPVLPAPVVVRPPAAPPPAAVYVPPPIPVTIPQDSYAEEPVVELGSIQIPKIGLHHTMFHGVTLHNIDLGPSHWPGTAKPGERGNTVVAGHRVTGTQPFLRIHELVEGDEVIFRVDGVRSTYRVVESFVVWPQDMWIAEQVTTISTATLYACHPPGSEAQRYVVRLALASTGPA